METMKKSADVFITEFSAQIAELSPHDFISKKQAKYLDDRKGALRQGEYIVISDFAENFSFVVQVGIPYSTEWVISCNLCGPYKVVRYNFH